MLDVDTLVADCRDALADPDPRRAVREVMLRALAKPGEAVEALSRPKGGIELIHNDAELTVLNVVWAPGMAVPPHDHRMWAAIGIYGGREDNTLFRRGPERIQKAGARTLSESEVLVLGADAIHAVANPESKFTGAIHVYGGDFVNMPRSQWDPDTLLEQPYDLAYIASLFEKANAEWAAQLEQDVDDEVS